MSCEECETFQERGSASYPFRWGRATVLLLACERHAKEIFDALKKHMQESRDRGEDQFV